MHETELTKVATVIRTLNYDKFKTMVGNRALGNRTTKIIASIQSNGYIMCPIIVNEKYEVIDGQGRLSALKALKMPVDYIVVPGADLKDCIAMNAQTTPWKIQDYIDSYVSQENENYIRLADLKQKHLVGYPAITNVAGDLYGSADKNLKTGNKAIINGTLEISEKDYRRADRVLDYIDGFVPTLKKVGGSLTYWSIALAFCYNHSTADPERLYNKVVQMSNELHPCANVKSAIDDIEAVYNDKCRKKCYLYAEYDKYLCEKVTGYAEKWSKKKKAK